MSKSTGQIAWETYYMTLFGMSDASMVNGEAAWSFKDAKDQAAWQAAADAVATSADERLAMERVIDLASQLNCCAGEDAERTPEMQEAIEALVAIRAPWHPMTHPTCSTMSTLNA